MNNFQGITIKREPNSYDGAENRLEDEDPGSRCGEIYVGNNAKKWTFICTFCDKSMLEINEFIMHIKHAHVHLPPPLPIEPRVADPHSEHSDSINHEVPSFNPLDKVSNEYVDYNDFLDVNVQTVPEVILSDVNGPSVKNESSSALTRIKSEPESDKEDIPLLKRITPRSLLAKTPRLPISTETFIESSPATQPVAKNRRQRKSRSRRKQIKGPAYCQICKRTFQYYSLYRNHMVKHTSETPFQCTVCSKGFKSKQAIRYHLTTHQREKPFKCELCEAGFYHEWQFVSHMETHRSENNHPCEVCGKVNRTKFDKDIHMRTHTGDRPFACEFCLKRFRLRHHLSNHLKLHLTYRCDFCRKQFRNGVSMKKPYACPECYSNANDMSDPSKEEDIAEIADTDDEIIPIHPPACTPRDPEAMKPVTCKICHKTYANKRGLSVHITTKH